MKNFLFVYRSEPNRNQPSPEEMQANMKRWLDWIGNIAAQDKLVDGGSGLQAAGKLVKQNTIVTDGPYTEIKEVVAGYSIVKATSIEEAASLADGCPIFNVGGSVEVREINMM
ncbi:hypothetical protein HDC92_001784 [Pedobacter sp. AK017]|uniref:YciI family protein n=1 Tax=Pedobacter sp. AK017 TaxID=2723073 RepID=UPI00160E590F|nr:YciI family protein [Pedobacter sp. AK017]MBB5438109.1 hypothetical protein [Pedobacter sp. AK017]